MLLKEYVRNVIGIVGFANTDERPNSLHLIGQFEFGDRYCILLLSGVRIDFVDLHSLLEILHDELRASETYDAKIWAQKRTLIVKPVNEMGRPWGRHVGRICDTVLDAVTTYNLTEQWPEPIRNARAAAHTTPWRDV